MDYLKNMVFGSNQEQAQLPPQEFIVKYFAIQDSSNDPQ